MSSGQRTGPVFDESLDSGARYQRPRTDVNDRQLAAANESPHGRTAHTEPMSNVSLREQVRFLLFLHTTTYGIRPESVPLTAPERQRRPLHQPEQRRR